MTLSSYNPDKWIVLRINSDEPHYRLFVTWAGGYTTGDSWRMNSGITSVVEDVEDHNYWLFFGESGSCYRCYKERYGIAGGYNYGVLNDYLDKGKMNLLDEDTDRLNFNWKMKKKYLKQIELLFKSGATQTFWVSEYDFKYTAEPYITGYNFHKPTYIDLSRVDCIMVIDQKEVEDEG